MADGPRRLQRKTMLLGTILVLGFVLRVWGLNFGLPNLSRPDEQNIADAVFVILNSFFAGHPSLNPEFFQYPSFYLYGVGFLYALYYLTGYLFGLFPDANAFYGLYLDDWGSFLLLSRLLTVLFGTASIWAFWRLVETATGSARAGLIGAGLLAITYLHVRDSHFGVTDIPATFLIIMTLWRVLRFRQRPEKRYLYQAAVLSGLAAATKYPAGLVAIPVIMAYGLDLKRQGLAWSDLLQRPQWLQRSLLLAGLIIGSFVLASPYILLDFPEFASDFAWQQGFMNSTILDLGLGWVRHLTFSLWYGLGPLYCLAALASILWIVRREPAETRATHWLLLGFLLIYYLLIGNTSIVFVRYAIPMIPVLALYTAWGIEQAGQILAAKFPAVSPNIAHLFLLGVVGFYSLQHSLQFDALAARPDTRTLARHWLLTHLLPREAVGVGMSLDTIALPSSFKKYELSISRYTVRSPLPSGRSGKATYTDQPLSLRNEYLISTYADTDQLRKLGIRFVAIGLTPLDLYTTPPAEVAAIESNPELKLVQHFSPDEFAPKDAYDQIDAFHIPLTALHRLRQPGPEIRIYRVLPD